MTDTAAQSLALGKIEGLPKSRVCQRCNKRRSIDRFPIRWGKPCKTCRGCYPQYKIAPPWQGSAHNRACRRWNRENPKKRAAHAAVRRALANGELVKPETCERCDAINVHAHHDSYEPAHWLDVKWLCPKHHAIRHAEIGKPWWRKGAEAGRQALALRRAATQARRAA